MSVTRVRVIAYITLKWVHVQQFGSIFAMIDCIQDRFSCSHYCVNVGVKYFMSVSDRKNGEVKKAAAHAISMCKHKDVFRDQTFLL